MRPPTVTERKLVVFKLADQRCALPAERIREIVPMPHLSRPPGLPSILEGFLNLGGVAIPVIRTARLFDLPEHAPGLYTPLLILRGGTHPTALLVQEVMEILSASTDPFSLVGEKTSFNDCLEAQIAVDHSVVHILDADRILLKEEEKAIAEFQALAQKRIDELKETI